MIISAVVRIRNYLWNQVTFSLNTFFFPTKTSLLEFKIHKLLRLVQEAKKKIILTIKFQKEISI